MDEETRFEEMLAERTHALERRLDRHKRWIVILGVVTVLALIWQIFFPFIAYFLTMLIYWIA